MDPPDLIATLYQTAVQPALLDAAVEHLCRRFGGCAAHILLERQGDPRPFRVAAPGWSQTAISDYFRHYAAIDPYLIEARANTASRVTLSQEVVSTSAFGESALYRDFSRHHTGAFHMVGARLMLADDVRIGIVVHRARDAEPFDEQAREEMWRISRHVHGALALGQQFEAAGLRAALSGAALDQCGHGAMVTDADAQLLYANEAADRLAKPVGLAPAMHGKLRAATPPLTARLHTLLRAAASGRAGGAMRLQGANEAVALRVSPLPPSLAAGLAFVAGVQGLALIMLRRLAPLPPVNAQVMIDLFGLTRAEAAVLPPPCSPAPRRRRWPLPAAWRCPPSAARHAASWRRPRWPICAAWPPWLPGWAHLPAEHHQF